MKMRVQGEVVLRSKVRLLCSDLVMMSFNFTLKDMQLCGQSGQKKNILLMYTHRRTVMNR